MTRGAGDHFALREKLKGFESIKELRDAGLVYDYVTTLNVQKTAFAVDSIAEAKRFYSETLGCPEVTFRSPYFLEIPLFGKLFVAVQIDGYRGPPPRPARTVVQEPCFGVETTAVNFRAFVARLKQAGVPYEYVASPDFENGLTCCFCEDPAGHRLYVAADIPRPATRRASLEGLDMSAMRQTPYTQPSREDSAKSRYTITPPPPDYTDADGMRWYPCDRADESLARPIPGTAQRKIIVAAPAPTRARRRSPARRARTSTDAPPAPWRSGVALCDERIDAFRVMLSKRPAAQPSWRCLHCSTENEPVVDWCRLCRAGRIRVSLAIAS